MPARPRRAWKLQLPLSEPVTSSHSSSYPGWAPMILILLGAGIIGRIVWPFFPGLVPRSTRSRHRVEDEALGHFSAEIFSSVRSHSAINSLDSLARQARSTSRLRLSSAEVLA